MGPEVRELSRAECLQRLAVAAYGRVGVSVDALPAIFPVLLAAVDDAVVLRTAPGIRLDRAAAGAIVAVEAGAVDTATGAGWSVLVRGIAHELDEGPQWDAARARLGATWLDDASAHTVRVTTDLVTGRHFR